MYGVHVVRTTNPDVNLLINFFKNKSISEGQITWKEPRKNI